MEQFPPSVHAAIVAAVESSQQELAEQVHDTVCQALAGSSMLASATLRRAIRGEPIAVEDIQRLDSAINTGLQQIRQLSHRLNPPILASGGLMPALQELAQNCPLPCAFTCEKPVFVSNLEIALALYRIARDSMRISLGLGASALEIKLAAEGDRIRLTIADDARPQDKDIHSRYKLIFHRALAIGAEIQFKPGEAGGCTITCIAPNSTDSQRSLFESRTSPGPSASGARVSSSDSPGELRRFGG